MATLQTSGAISINDIKTLFGGPTSPALSNYYRGGTYIPATKVVSTLVYEPTSGEYYSGSSPYWMWYIFTPSGYADIYWNSASVTFSGININATTYTSGAYTYYRGTLRLTSDYKGSPIYQYGIYRSSGSSSTVNINTNIPTSGAISLSQFYGAEKP